MIDSTITSRGAGLQPTRATSKASFSLLFQAELEDLHLCEVDVQADDGFFSVRPNMSYLSPYIDKDLIRGEFLTQLVDDGRTSS